jgi:hypothetical protein
MITIWKCDYKGADLPGDLEKINKIHSLIMEKVGGKVEGPYLPLDAAVMFIYNIDKFEMFIKGSRLWFDEVAKAGLPFIWEKSELAVTPEEFF